MNLIIIDNDTQTPRTHKEIDVTEQTIEELVEKYPESLLGEKILIISRQLRLESGKRLDLLGLTAQGECVIIELKKGIAPREVYSQAQDYITYIMGKTSNDLEELYEKYKSPGISLEYKLLPKDFKSYFQINNSPKFDTEKIRVIIICGETEEELEKKMRIHNKTSSIKIDLLRIKIFESEDKKYVCSEPIIKESNSVYSPKTTHSVLSINQPFFDKIESVLREKLPEKYKNFTVNHCKTWDRILWGESYQVVDYFFGVDVSPSYGTGIYCFIHKPTKIETWVKESLKSINEHLANKFSFNNNKKSSTIWLTVIPHKSLDTINEHELNQIVDVLTNMILYLKPEFDKLVE